MGRRRGRLVFLFGILTFGILFANFASAGWIVKTVDSTTTDAGYYTSIAVDSNNKAHIAEYDNANSDLKYCNNTASNGAWSCKAIDLTGGRYSSIAVDSNNKIHISEQSVSNGDLKYCNNTASNGAWSCTTIDSTNDVGNFASIAIDLNNKVHIAEYDDTGDNLRYCNNTASNGAWSCTTIDSTNDRGQDSSIEIDSNNKAHISEYDFTAKDLRYCNNTASNGAWSCIVVDSATGGGQYSSIAIDSNNRVHIAEQAQVDFDFHLRYVTFDNVRPNVNIISPVGNNTNTSNANFDVNYTFLDDWVTDSIWYANDTFSVANKSLGSGGTYFNITNLTWSSGKHNVTIYVNDSANNLNWSTISFTIDTLAPDLNITSPANNTNTTDDTIDLEYTRSDINLESCWYSNDTYLVNTTIPSCGNITTIIWSEGKHNATIYTNDSADNLNFSTISFTIDTIAPSISIINPSQNNTQTAKTGIDINYTFSDSGVGINSCWYSNDTYSVNTTLANCENITTLTWSDAYHNVTIWADDFLGNLNSASVSFTVKSSAPDTNYASPTESSGVFKSRDYILINVTAVDSNLDSILIRLYDSANTLINYSLTETSPNYVNFSGLSEGVYYYNATANDTLDNFLDLETRNITLDTTVPSINSFSCTPSSVNSGATVTCSCSGSDSLSGVQITSFTENPSTLNTGTFSETCTATDFAGNTGIATASYVVESVFTGSSGGTTADKTFVISSITPEGEISLANFKIDSGIKSMVIKVKEAALNSKIKVYGYGQQPPEGIIEQELKTYKYFEVNATSLENKLEKAIVTTLVEKTWIAENNLTKDGISLFRLDETSNKWNEIDTDYIAEDEDYYYYKTELDSFSIFSISEKAKNVIQEIITQITKSYGEASKTFLGLLVWWMLIFMLLTAIVLTLVVIISQITAEFKEHFINAKFLQLNHQLKNNNALRKTI